tara:strand:- start:52 stop:756 length:705 start_codon:yes stop_codon:yes gene_type:complete
MRKNIINNLKTQKYNFLNNKGTHTKIQSFKPIISTKTPPTSDDYKQGFYTRYFCKRNNINNVYFEISKETYKALKSKNGKYDNYLHTEGKIRWAIDGDIIKANNSAIKQQSSQFPNLQILFSQLHEFHLKRKTEGGELKYLNGKEYKGLYHLHNGQPMVGSYHSENPHQILEFLDGVGLQEIDIKIPFTYKNNKRYKMPKPIQKRTGAFAIQDPSPIKPSDPPGTPPPALEDAW